MRGQLRERQMHHAPADRSFLEVASDEQLCFVRVACFLPNAFPMRIAPGEHLVHGIEGRDRVLRMLAGEAGREAIPAGFRVAPVR